MQIAKLTLKEELKTVWYGKNAFGSEDLVAMKIQKQLNHKLRSASGKEREKIETLLNDENQKNGGTRETLFTHLPQEGIWTISVRLLKACSKELARAWCPICQESLETQSIIISVPKKPSCKENNDFLPVECTSLVMRKW